MKNEAKELLEWQDKEHDIQITDYIYFIYNKVTKTIVATFTANTFDFALRSYKQFIQSNRVIQIDNYILAKIDLNLSKSGPALFLYPHNIEIKELIEKEKEEKNEK